MSSPAGLSAWPQGRTSGEGAWTVLASFLCVICWEAALLLGSVRLQGYGFLHACELLIPPDTMSSNIALDAGCRALNVLHKGKEKQLRNTWGAAFMTDSRSLCVRTSSNGQWAPQFSNNGGWWGNVKKKSQFWGPERWPRGPELRPQNQCRAAHNHL